MTPKIDKFLKNCPAELTYFDLIDLGINAAELNFMIDEKLLKYDEERDIYRPAKGDLCST
jgi:hypothetical protein